MRGGLLPPPRRRRRLRWLLCAHTDLWLGVHSNLLLLGYWQSSSNRVLCCVLCFAVLMIYDVHVVCGWVCGWVRGREVLPETCVRHGGCTGRPLQPAAHSHLLCKTCRVVCWMCAAISLPHTCVHGTATTGDCPGVSARLPPSQPRPHLSFMCECVNNRMQNVHMMLTSRVLWVICKMFTNTHTHTQNLSLHLTQSRMMRCFRAAMFRCGRKRTHPPPSWNVGNAVYALELES